MWRDDWWVCSAEANVCTVFGIDLAKLLFGDFISAENDEGRIGGKGEDGSPQARAEPPFPLPEGKTVHQFI